MTITPIYAAVLAVFLVWLSINVIKLRQRFKITLGDGNNPSLRAAITAQSNATQYIPIALLLILMLEMNGAHWLLLNLFGLALLIGRILHARAIMSAHIPTRVRGMQLTLFTIIGAAIANLLFVVF